MRSNSATLKYLSAIAKSVFMGRQQPFTENSGKGCCISSDRSISRVLSGENHRDGHFSRSTITRTLQQPTRGVLIEVGALAAYLALLQLGFTMPAVLPRLR